MAEWSPDLELASSWAAEFAHAHDEVDAIYLVGSRAKGAAQPDSDFDFIIAVDTGPGGFFFETVWVGWGGNSTGGAAEAAALGLVPEGVPVDIYVFHKGSLYGWEVPAFLREGAERVWPRAESCVTRARTVRTPVLPPAGKKLD